MERSRFRTEVRGRPKRHVSRVLREPPRDRVSGLSTRPHDSFRVRPSTCSGCDTTGESEWLYCSSLALSESAVLRDQAPGYSVPPPPPLGPRPFLLRRTKARTVTATAPIATATAAAVMNPEGPTGSVTVTPKDAVAVFPAESVAVHMTVVVPMPKVDPEDGEQLTTGEGSTRSVDVASKVTGAPER